MGRWCPVLFILLLWFCPECSPCMEGSSTNQLCERDRSSWADLFSAERLDAWLCSLLGSLMVGLSGVLPLLLIPLEAGATLKSKEGSQHLKQLLSFAIGGLLGDVFLHLLPEAWAYTCSATTGGVQTLQQQQLLGLWVIIGFVSFLVLEKTFPDERPSSEQQETALSTTSSSSVPDRLLNGPCFPRKQIVLPRKAKANCGHSNGSLRQPQSPQGSKIKISGYLNLLANTIDNFTHGMAVAGSFLVSKKVGILTTVAILLHEIPHEVGDFAILLRAGFDRWSAAKMQLITALGAILGACFAICAQSPKGAGETVAWILPFTSGGFLYIALVNVLPDLLEEKSPRYSLTQVCLLCGGISVMVVLSFTAE
ncbi:zinc transporter ZIP13 [Rhinatrema bivittatum]|uniref:zinc transporter ZIP13 n=1 Tax=Rhinatrema bivittatum TaxID=194408 RepID=UPI0011298AE1|nr:zinc transporter ZIP13 [Rhinatrema bivittatum]XP_029437918.1 zinc transporter ZIP13 [Rhinatrema bivittatum]